MDLTSAIGTLGSDYVNKVTSAMKDNASLKTTGTSDSDTTFDAIYDFRYGIRQQLPFHFAAGRRRKTAGVRGFVRKTRRRLSFQKRGRQSDAARYGRKRRQLCVYLPLS